mgnify:CR=1 FL=1
MRSLAEPGSLATKSMAAKKEPTKKKASSKPRVCGQCGEVGHNARSCKSTEAEASVERVQEEADKVKDALLSTAVAIETKIDAIVDSHREAVVAESTTPARKKAKAKKAKVEADAKAADEAFDFGDSPEEPKEVEDPSARPEGSNLNTPKRKRKRTKAEQAFWAATEKKLAPDSIAGAGELTLELPRISTGNFGVDVALYGGIPQGRIIRFWGQPKSGKTGSCLNTVATYQREHCSECFQKTCKCKDRDVPDVVWIDAENRMNDMLYWPKAHGINLDCMRILCPPTGQNVVDFVDHIIRSQDIAKVGLFVVAPLAHVVSTDELNKPTLDGVTVGRSAYLLNQAWKRWTSAIHSLGIKNECKPTILCINQIRHKVGVMFGSPETMPGGIGQDFATSVDVRFSSGPPTYVVYDEKKEQWIAKQKKSGSNFKPPKDASPDFMEVRYRITASGICPSGRYGEFNYWLKSAHNHRCGDPDNGLQLWQYSKRYGLVTQSEGKKHLFGHSARKLEDLRESFRHDPVAVAKAREIIMAKLVAQ